MRTSSSAVPDTLLGFVHAQRKGDDVAASIPKILRRARVRHCRRGGTHHHGLMQIAFMDGGPGFIDRGLREQPAQCVVRGNVSFDFAKSSIPTQLSVPQMAAQIVITQISGNEWPRNAP